jgi:hypothetical protein
MKKPPESGCSASWWLRAGLNYGNKKMVQNFITLKAVKSLIECYNGYELTT